jgi:hypothetical protein
VLAPPPDPNAIPTPGSNATPSTTSEGSADREPPDASRKPEQ